MKPLRFVLFAVLLILLAACQKESATEALPTQTPPTTPTAMTFPTAAPTVTPVQVNPTATSGAEQAQAGDERVSSVDGMTMVYIPAGSFWMGGFDAKAQIDEKPSRQVTMRGFWMDKVEVTNGMYLRCIQAGACNPPDSFTSYSRDKYFNNTDFDNFPVILVTWNDARDYCTWAGRRLPTEAEWEYAARGPDLRTYPWGDDEPDATRANYLWLVRDTSAVGSFPAGASPFGLLDMAGNVWEWVADYYNPSFYAIAGVQNPFGPSSPVGGERRVIRGGSWQNEAMELRVSNRGYALGPDDKAPQGSAAYLGDFKDIIGFRCTTDQ